MRQTILTAVIYLAVAIAVMAIWEAAVQAARPILGDLG